MARKVGFFMAWVQSLQRSRAVEQLDGLARPCGLAKLLLPMPIFHAILFISLRKRVTLFPLAINCSILSMSCRQSTSTLSSLIILANIPPTSAIRYAASLPLGSIMPKKRSCSEYTAPWVSSAVVPIMLQLFLLALTFTRCGSTPVLSTSWRMATRFIILVRLAISLFLQFLLPYRLRPSRISYSIQLFADTSGISDRSTNAPSCSGSKWQDLLRAEETDRADESSLRMEPSLEEGRRFNRHCESRWLREADEAGRRLRGRGGLWLMRWVVLVASGGQRSAVAETIIVILIN